MFEREKLLYECDTAHDHYQVIDMTYEGRKARVLFSGDKKAAFSGMPLDDDHTLLFDYIQRLYELVSNIRPQRMLLIGGGTYTLPIALLQSLPDIHIDVVEIDEALDDIAEAFFGLTHNKRLTIIHTDGRSFLEQNSTVYDLIVIDAFTGLQIPQSLGDNDTAKLIHSQLSDNGVFAMNIISSYHGRNARAIEHFYELYNARFARTTVYPADVGVSLWSPQNLMLTAQKSGQSIDYAVRYQPLDAPVANTSFINKPIA